MSCLEGEVKTLQDDNARLQRFIAMKPARSRSREAMVRLIADRVRSARKPQNTMKGAARKRLPSEKILKFSDKES